MILYFLVYHHGNPAAILPLSANQLRKHRSRIYRPRDGRCYRTEPLAEILYTHCNEVNAVGIPQVVGNAEDMVRMNLDHHEKRGVTVQCNIEPYNNPMAVRFGCNNVAAASALLLYINWKQRWQQRETATRTIIRLGVWRNDACVDFRISANDIISKRKRPGIL